MREWLHVLIPKIIGFCPSHGVASFRFCNLVQRRLVICTAAAYLAWFIKWWRWQIIMAAAYKRDGTCERTRCRNQSLQWLIWIIIITIAASPQKIKSHIKSINTKSALSRIRCVVSFTREISAMLVSCNNYFRSPRTKSQKSKLRWLLCWSQKSRLLRWSRKSRLLPRRTRVEWVDRDVYGNE